MTWEEEWLLELPPLATMSGPLKAAGVPWLSTHGVRWAWASCPKLGSSHQLEEQVLWGQ